ncbi:hypothetical protein SAMN02745117_00044 [Lampropedia hyalina DSM 16112]|jgi:hypothetical protein|uniref:Uncharacterized protein n=1 Tax=Lampropedia hyalina DSM 16112 TaxID=1122156 RepID=A0A1M4S9H9_9BURK|nr:choice-of-anchor tandem repeat GloVer-containing protein [Lampropedia hyalina]SHE28851.1 hypothetical protein SAMN02745117_00044 [Lampropedia hyalina DSM 16112]
MTQRNHKLPLYRHSGLDPESSEATPKGNNRQYGKHRAAWIPAFAGMTHFLSRHSGLDPESSDAASKGNNRQYGKHRAAWIPAFAGMTHFLSRHSGLDPESSDAASKGNNRQYGKHRAAWIPAFAGMTGTELMLKLLCASSITLGSLLAMQTAHAAYPQVDTLVNFTGNLPEGGNGARPGYASNQNDIPSSPLVAGSDGYLYGSVQYGAGTEAVNNNGGAGGMLFRYDLENSEFQPLLTSSYSNNRWLQILKWGSDGVLYNFGRLSTAEGTLNGMFSYDPASQQLLTLNSSLPTTGTNQVFGQAVELNDRFYFISNRTNLLALEKDGSVVGNDVVDTDWGAKIYLAHSQTGRLYGMVRSSSAYGPGPNAFVSIDPANPSDRRIIHAFEVSTQSTGIVTVQNIQAMVEDADDGMVYVVSQSGGAQNGGALWRFHPDAGAEGSSHELELLYSFPAASAADVTPGRVPTALVQGADGHIYGAASSGGLFGQGVIFRYHKTDGYQRMYSFGASTGDSPNAAPNGINLDGMQPSKLIRSGDALYGYTQYGGNTGWGTLFKFTPGDELPGSTSVNLSWQPELASLTVAQGYSREIVWSSWLTTNCQATTTDPTGETQWGGATTANGTKALTFNTIGTWTYTLKCDSTIADTDPVSKNITIEVVTAESQEETVGNDGGGSFTPALVLLPLLGAGYVRRRRKAAR